MKDIFLKLRDLTLIFALVMGVAMTGCRRDDKDNEPSVDKRVDKVVLLFENDVHGAIDGYPVFAGYRDAVADTFQYVVTVSCGDCMSGSPVCSCFDGQSIVSIMQSVGYDYMVPGNHEFDYSVEQMIALVTGTGAKPLCCNFIDVKSGKSVFGEYAVKDYGGTKVGFVGVTFPMMENLVATSTLIDESGAYKYNFGGENVAQVVQTAVDAAKTDGAGTIVILSHVGSEILPEMIGKLSGVDVVLDAHSHVAEPAAYLKDKTGKDVLWTSTGTQFKNIGRVEISNSGKVSSMLLATSDISQKSENVSKVVGRIQSEYDALTMTEIGYSDAYLSAYDENGTYLLRSGECSIGNFCADALRTITGAQIGVVNGGGIRAEIQAGKLTYATIMSVFPFMNEMCVIKVSGRSIKAALETSYANIPAPFGGFLHMAGMKVEIDSTREAGNRVMKVMVDNGNGIFEEMQDETKYTIGGSLYVLMEGGDGIVFEGAERQPMKTHFTDTELLIEYVTKTLNGRIAKSYEELDGRIKFVHDN